MTAKSIALTLISGTGEDKVTGFKTPKSGEECGIKINPNTWRVEGFYGASYVGYYCVGGLYVGSLIEEKNKIMKWSLCNDVSVNAVSE